jgi:hypothetical protein
VRHIDPIYRHRHTSLHYRVWDSIENVNSIFVENATVPTKKDQKMAQLLNLLEIYTSCIFQTLRHNDLEKYLPDDITIPWGGHHLSVALPL